MKIFSCIGDASVDYRTIMHNHTDFYIGNKLIPINRLVICEQTHSKLVHNCTEADSGAGFSTHPQISEADGLITSLPGQYLLIRTADCTPVLLWDEKKLVVSALHSGREGTRKNICAQAILQMQSEYGCDPETIKAIIGPGICADHYQVSPEIYSQFLSSIEEQGIQPHSGYVDRIDIQGTVYAQLIACGLNSGAINRIRSCTYESESYFSYRRNGTKNRQINIIGIEL